jgi:hypothetical protein
VVYAYILINKQNQIEIFHNMMKLWLNYINRKNEFMRDELNFCD